MRNMLPELGTFTWSKNFIIKWNIKNPEYLAFYLSLAHHLLYQSAYLFFILDFFKWPVFIQLLRPPLVSFQSTLVCAGWNYNNCAVAAINLRVSLINFSLEVGDECRTTNFWHRQVRPRAKPSSADSTAPDLQTAKGTDDSLLLLLKSAQKIQLIHNP